MLNIHSFETLGGLDGPGIRFIVFLQGCNLRCKYCHNPDTWDMSVNKSYEIEVLYKKIIRCLPYFGENGGVTFSGGEPLLQAASLLKLIKILRDSNIKISIDTSGGIFNEDVKKCLKSADLVILDVKHTDKTEYNKLTGGNFESFTKTWKYLKNINKETWLRQVIVPTITDDAAQVENLLDYKSENVTKIELLPYHRLGISKWNVNEYELINITPPTAEKMEQLNKIIKIRGI